MRIARMVMRLVVGGVLVQLTGCGDDDPKVQDYSQVKLSINELQASNQTSAYDEYNEADDWVELFNAGKESLELTGFHISDDTGTPEKHTFAAGVSVPAGGVTLIWFDGDPEQGANHLAFKLSATAGESVVISDPNGGSLDSVDFGLGSAGQSFARHPDGTGAYAWCASPTPSGLNGDACQSPTP